jgi:hypothetical protein
MAGRQRSSPPRRRPTGRLYTGGEVAVVGRARLLVEGGEAEEDATFAAGESAFGRLAEDEAPALKRRRIAAHGAFSTGSFGSSNPKRAAIHATRASRSRPPARTFCAGRPVCVCSTDQLIYLTDLSGGSSGTYPAGFALRLK